MEKQTTLKKLQALNHITQDKLYSCLDLNDLYTISKVNKYFRQVVYDNRLFQKYIEVI